MSACHEVGCNRQARIVPLLLVPARGWPLALHRPSRMIFNLPLCRDHFKAMNVADLVNDDNKQAAIEAFTAGKIAHPDFDRARLESLAIDSAEFAEFLRRLSPARMH